MNIDATTDARQVYANQMLEIKRRFRVIDRILGAKKPRLTWEAYDDEAAWLQLRYIVELVAFASLVTDVDRYAALRTEQDRNSDIKADWRAGKILGRLEKINPHYLPFPHAEPVIQPGGEFMVPRAQGETTKSRLVDIHEAASMRLHAPSPFEPRRSSTEQDPASRSAVVSALGELKQLLWRHAKVGLVFASGDKPTELASPSHVWLVDFKHPDSDEIGMLTAVADQP